MEFSIKRANALFKKEIKDLGKNMNVLLMCMLPIMFSIVYSKMLGGETTVDSMEKIDILILCLGMNIVLIAAFIIAMLIAEEKEKNTLRTLMLSAVSPLEFFTGKALITFFIAEINNVVMFFIIGVDTQYLGQYILLTTLVVFSMIGIGAIIGLLAPNQMATGVVGMPVLTIFYMIPLFAEKSKTLTKIAEFLPTYNLNLLLKKVVKGEAIVSGSAFSISMILAWILISAVAFAYTYNKRGLDK